MNITDYKHQKRMNYWLAQRFEGKKSVSVVIDLLPCRINCGQQEWLTRDIIDQTARRIRNKINHAYFGKSARRFGKGLKMTFNLHETPQSHFHCIIEIPENECFLKFKSRIETICLNDGWIKPISYIAETKDNYTAQYYNNRFGSDTLILF